MALCVTALEQSAITAAFLLQRRHRTSGKRWHLQHRRTVATRAHYLPEAAASFLHSNELHLDLLASLGTVTDPQQEVMQLAMAAGLPVALVQKWLVPVASLLLYSAAPPGPLFGLLDYLAAPLHSLTHRTFDASRVRVGRQMGEGNYGVVFEGFYTQGEGSEKEDIHVVLKRVKSRVEEASMMQDVELFMNHRMERTAPDCSAKFLGTMEVSPKSSNSRLQQGLWLVWQYQGDRTLEFFLRRRGYPLNLLPPLLGLEPRLLDLSNKERQQWLEWEVAQAVMKQLLSILQGLHSSGVVHRDVKPANMVLDEANGRFFIIDLGACVDLRSGHNFVPNETVMDPTYAAPERFVMPPLTTPKYTPEPFASLISPLWWTLNSPDRFDIFSAGVIFMQLCVKSLRTDVQVVAFKTDLKRCDYDLKKWREEFQPAAADMAVLDAHDGAAFQLAAIMLQQRPNKEAAVWPSTYGIGRPSASMALQHRFFRLSPPEEHQAATRAAAAAARSSRDRMEQARRVEEDRRREKQEKQVLREQQAKQQQQQQQAEEQRRRGEQQVKQQQLAQQKAAMKAEEERRKEQQVRQQQQERQRAAATQQQQKQQQQQGEGQHGQGEVEGGQGGFIWPFGVKAEKGGTTKQREEEQVNWKWPQLHAQSERERGGTTKQKEEEQVPWQWPTFQPTKQAAQSPPSSPSQKQQQPADVTMPQSAWPRQMPPALAAAKKAVTTFPNTSSAAAADVASASAVKSQRASSPVAPKAGAQAAAGVKGRGAADRRAEGEGRNQQQVAGRTADSVGTNRRSGSGGGNAGQSTNGPSLGEQLRRQPITAAYLVGAAAASAGAWLSEAAGSQAESRERGEEGEGAKKGSGSQSAAAAVGEKEKRGSEPAGRGGGEEGSIGEDAVEAVQSMLAAIAAALNVDGGSSSSREGRATSEEQAGEKKEKGKGGAAKAPVTPAAVVAAQQPAVRSSAAEPAAPAAPGAPGADKTGRKPGAKSGVDALLGQQLAALKTAWSDIVSAAFAARGGAAPVAGGGRSEEGEKVGGASTAQQESVVPRSYLSKESRSAVQALLDRHSSLRRYAEQQGTLEMKDGATARSADPLPGGDAPEVVTLQLQELQQLRAQRAASAAGLLQVVAELDGQMSALEESIRDGRDFAAQQQEMLARMERLLLQVQAQRNRAADNPMQQVKQSEGGGVTAGTPPVGQRGGQN